MPPLTLPSVRLPGGLPDGLAVRGPGKTGEELGRFAHTTTRLLLGSDGLTTPCWRHGSAQRSRSAG